MRFRTSCLLSITAGLLMHVQIQIVVEDIILVSCLV